LRRDIPADLADPRADSTADALEGLVENDERDPLDVAAFANGHHEPSPNSLEGRTLVHGVHVSTPLLSPTAENPLRGLVHLAKVAIVGSKPLRELANAPILYIWQDVALLGIIVVLAGGPGSGKTTLLFWILVARLNTGAPIMVLGREVTPAPVGTYVVLIEGEHSGSSAARKMVRTCRFAGIENPDAAFERLILIARKAVRIGSPAWQDVERLIAEGLVSDVALDTLARVAPADANSESEQVAIFDRVAQAVERAPSEGTRPVVWTVAHTRKGDGEDLEGVSGSTQRTGQADTVLMVKAERADGRVIGTTIVFAKLREDPDDYPRPIVFRLVDVDGKPSVVTEEATGGGEKGAPIAASAVLAVFAEVGGEVGLTLSKAREFVAASRGGQPGAKAHEGTVRKHLATLTAQGAISKCQIETKTGKTFEGWRYGKVGGTVGGQKIGGQTSRRGDGE
jgi:hypothetical protein